MERYSIRIGATDGYRCVGVRPPVDEEMKRQIFDVLGDNIEQLGVATGRPFSTVGTGESAYSELGLDSGIMEASRIKITTVARQVADVIRKDGATVFINSDLKGIEHNKNLFDADLRPYHS